MSDSSNKVKVEETHGVYVQDRDNEGVIKGIAGKA